MTATINGNVWFDSTFGQPGFGSSNLLGSNHSGYEISTTDERPNTICNGISISLYLVPQIGRYYFNGSRLGVSSDSGVVAVYTNNGNLNDPYKTSISGYVENTDALTPIRHTNLALNNAGVRGSILVDFPEIVNYRYDGEKKDLIKRSL